MTYVIQILVGLAFTLIWFLVFRFLIKKFNFKTPGREDEAEETKLYTKKDYKEKQAEKIHFPMQHRFWTILEEKKI